MWGLNNGVSWKFLGYLINRAGGGVLINREGWKIQKLCIYSKCQETKF